MNFIGYCQSLFTPVLFDIFLSYISGQYWSFMLF
uniref:Uncharacterized protein n=1 Tax=Rhizophora mucronata TaxID=61149 RepID=A0A2P2MN76_RHIMU